MISGDEKKPRFIIADLFFETMMSGGKNPEMYRCPLNLRTTMSEEGKNPEMYHCPPCIWTLDNDIHSGKKRFDHSALHGTNW
jgi:hypothetical protein